MRRLTRQVDSQVDNEACQPDTAWTRRRFLGALLASAVAAGVKIPGAPAAERLVELASDLGSRDTTYEAYWLIIHPRAIDNLLFDTILDDDGEPVSTLVDQIEVTAEVGRLQGVRILTSEGLNTALEAMKAGHVPLASVAAPLWFAPHEYAVVEGTGDPADWTRAA